MKNLTINIIILSSMIMGTTVMAGGGDDPLLTMLQVDQLEKRDANSGYPLVWEIQGWAGYDLDKITFKTKGERVNEKTESAELQLLYSKAIAPYWDLQAGIRHDFNPKPSQNWAAIGIQGLAPYFFETDVNLFVGESGQTNFRLATEYEVMLTQKLVLSPEAEINLFGKNDKERGIGSGISDVELGLRLRYEIRREFAPYIGINWERKLGQTASYARDEGEVTNDTQLVMGIRGWF